GARDRRREPLLVHADERVREPGPRHLDGAEAALRPAAAQDPPAGERPQHERARALARERDLGLALRVERRLEEPEGDARRGGDPGEGLRLAREVARELAADATPRALAQVEAQPARERVRGEGGAQALGAGAALVAAEVARRALAGDRLAQAPGVPGPRSASF